MREFWNNSWNQFMLGGALGASSMTYDYLTGFSFPTFPLIAAVLAVVCSFNVIFRKRGANNA